MSDVSPHLTDGPRASRHLAPWIAGVVVLLAAAYGGAWWTSATLLRSQVARWIDLRRADGYAIQTGAMTVSGFPGEIAVRLPNVAVTAPAQKGGWRWQTAALQVLCAPMMFSRLTIDLAGAHEFAGGWLPPGTSLGLSGGKAELTLHLNKGRLDGATFAVEKGAAGWVGGQPLLQVDKAATALHLVPAPNGSPSQNAQPTVTSNLTVDVADLSLAAPLPPPFTPTLHHIAVNANVEGPVVAGPLPQMLEAWRSSGGAIDLKDFVVDWPPLFIAGNGTVALDEQLQPMGAFSAKVRGFSEAIDAAAGQGGLKKRDAAVAKGVLGLMAKAPANGGAPELTLPVTVQNRMLSVGPLTLFRMPEVIWR